MGKEKKTVTAKTVLENDWKYAVMSNIRAGLCRTIKRTDSITVALHKTATALLENLLKSVIPENLLC